MQLLADRRDEFRSAYERVEPEFGKVSEVSRIVTDIPRTVLTVLGAAPGLKALRPQIVEELPRFDIAQLDKLEDYAYATLYAHATAGAVGVVDVPIQPLLDDALPLRQKLLSAADLHVSFGDLAPGPVAAIRAGTGHTDSAADLVALVDLFRAHWPSLRGRTRVTPEDLERAVDLGFKLLQALSGAVRASDPGAERRAKCYTLLLGAYDECERAASYLRWHEDDIDVVMPSLFAKYRRRAPKAAGSAPGDGSVTPAPEPVAPPAPNGAPIDVPSPMTPV